MKVSIKIFAVFYVFFTLACKSNEEKIKPTTEPITESVYASGIVKSKNQYQVFATVNGLLKEALFTEGSLIKKGDILFKIQNTSAQLNKENAMLAENFASINEKYSDKLNELKINIDLAKSKWRNDSIMLERQKALWAQNIGSKVELEQKELAFKNSSIAYQGAILRYNDLNKQIDFSAKQAQKNLQISGAQVSDFEVKSETNGRVYNILKKQGELITPQSPIAVIGDENNFILELQVDEYDIAKIKLGQKILLILDSYKGKSFTAQVSKIIPIMNERTRSFTIEAVFTEKPNTLFPNLTVEANIIIQTKENALTIPRNYLFNDSFVMLQNKEKRKVSVGLKDYEKVEILGGINKDDNILKPTK